MSGQREILIIADYLEEGWPSMDLAADMLEQYWPATSGVRARLLRPRMYRPLQGIPVFGRLRAAFNAERFFGRFVAYPVGLRSRRNDFCLFHVADHSYAHLVEELPQGRTGVYCFDLDAFRCLFGGQRRAPWLRAMARRTLSGLQRAAVVFYSTQPVKDEIVARGLLDPARLVYAPLGVAPEFSDQAPAPEFRLHSRLTEPFVLHVGSTIPRKRMDVLIDTFAELRRQLRELRLVKVGGPWTPEQVARIARHGVSDSVTRLEGLSRTELAEVYRRAKLCLLPSEAEGFGLPLVEALACGAPVLASDIPVFREVGGEAVRYLPVGDVGAWTAAALDWLTTPDAAPPRELRLRRAAEFSWPRYAEIIAQAYEQLT